MPLDAAPVVTTGTDQDPAGPRGAAEDHTPVRAGRVALVALQALMLIIVFGQRLAVPVGGEMLSVVLPAAYIALAVLIWTGVVHHDRLRFELFLLAMGACALVATLVGLFGGTYSQSSLLLLIAIWAPWVYCVRERYAWVYQRLLRFYLNVMAVVASLALFQIGTQLAGAEYIDPLADFPSRYLLGDFNTSYPLTYGSDIFKSNAYVMLEPSFLSQFLGLAIVLQIVIGGATWKLFLYAAGIVSSVSGTGILLVVAGVLLIVARTPHRIRRSMVACGVACVALALMTPIGEVLLDRRDETTTQGSSGNLRFVQPYTLVREGLDTDPDRYLVGAGPGMAERVLISSGEGGGLAVVYPIAPKFIFEYGLVAGAIGITFITVCLFHRARYPVVPASCFVLLFVLSGSLLQPHTVFAAWLLTSLFARAHPDSDTPFHASGGGE